MHNRFRADAFWCRRTLVAIFVWGLALAMPSHVFGQSADPENAIDVDTLAAPQAEIEVQLKDGEMEADIPIVGWFCTGYLAYLNESVGKLNDAERKKLAGQLVDTLFNSRGAVEYWERLDKAFLKSKGRESKFKPGVWHIPVAEGASKTEKIEHCYTADDLEKARKRAYLWASSVLPVIETPKK